MNKRLLFLLLLTVLSLNLALAQRSPKRGIAYGGHSLEDMNALSPGISWWYNWSDRPDVNLRAYYASLGVEFVPMCWNNNFNVNDVIARIPQGAKYLLAYNEPNFYVEANMSPEFAASVWGRLEQIAAARGLQIVSACPAYCGGSACPPEFYDPNEWHRRFFEACPNCWVDYIAFHTYEAAGSGGGAISLSNNLKRWGRPIWVTEFADWYSSTLSAKTTWMNNVVNAYENDPDIFRYSWFTGRSSANPQINLLGANGQLTPLGENYLNRPIAKRYPAPGRIEAENHYRRNRTQLETCQDAGGGQNVSHTDAGDWVDYLIDVTTAGAYTFEFRVAGQGNGNINILVNEQLAKSNIALPPTGEWQTWSTVQVRDVILPEGMNLVRFHFNTGGVNLNFFNVVTQSNSAPVANFSATPLSTCTQNVIVFTDQSLNKVGNETFSWNFGAGATPATATGVGPHNVRYSTGGQKTVSLTVTNANGTNTNTKNNYITIENPPTGCIFSDDFTDNVVSWIIPGPFSFAETAGEMRVSNNGYGEWDNFRYQLNNGSIASSFNFQCAANKPVVKIRAKASANCLLSLSMRDGNGRTVDNYNAMNLELTTTYQTFTIDFAGRFRNFYSGNPGILDSTNITDLILAINPAYFSYPITGTSGRVYNSAFAGRVDIDWIGIGDNCSPSTNIVANFDANKTVVCTGEGVVFTNTTSNAPAGSTYSWNFGAGANPATATGVGPHTVTYSSNGLKTVSLVVSSNGVSNTRTRTDYINVAYSPAGCLFSDDYDNNTVSWISPLTGPFAHSESGTDWRITTNGHNEWDAFNYTINNGAAAQPLNFGCSSNKPVLRIRAKASANCLLSISMADINGRTTDAMAGLNNLELTTSYQTFTINYSGRFRNLYGASPGMLDSLIISRLSFMVNPGFASWPVTGTSGRVYNTAFIGNIDINWIGIGDNCTQTPAVVANFSANQTNTCTGTNITFTSSSTGTSSGTTYSWNFGSGANPATATGAGPHNVSYSTAGTKTVSLSLNGGAATETKTNYITVTASVTPSVSIAITSGSNPTCSGSSVTFTATPTNGGTAPTYQWRINGTNVATGATLTRNNLNNGDQVSCVMTSNATCASPLTATSNTITMNVTASVTPAASIAITSGSNPTCSGSSVTFTATPTNGGTAPTYLWRINGANVGTGATLTRNNLNNGDQVSCVLTSNATCASAATATSNTITMTVNPLPNTSAISGNSNPACNATGITYSVTGGTNSTYVWTVPSGAQITGSATGNSITVNFGSSNGNITVRETSQAGCQGPQRQLAINLTGCSMVANFTASPTTICRNETVTFTNTSTGVTTGATYSWNFGAGASPGTANGAGPHQVIYTTSGSKTVSLQIVNGATVSETKTNYIQVTDVAQAYAGNNQSITTTTTTMAANQPSAGMGIGTWTEVSSSGSVVFANPNSATSNVSGLGQGANLLRWTITNANCSTFAEVTITVNNLVIDGPSTVVPNQIYSFSIDGGANSSYNWLLPQGATLVTGQGTGSVDISFSSGFTGTISVTVVNNGTSTTISKEISAIVTGQQSSSAKGSVTLYPNPCENKSLLKYETADVQKMDIRIFDQKGVTLYSESGLWTNEYIEIGEGLPAGVWFVQVSTADKIEIIKVVKLQ